MCNKLLQRIASRAIIEEQPATNLLSFRIDLRERQNLRRMQNRRIESGFERSMKLMGVTRLDQLSRENLRFR